MTSDKLDQTRRSFLKHSGMAALGALSLADLFEHRVLAQAISGSAAPMNVGVLGSGHVRARAKRVIHLHMLGAMSHVDTFDYKPTLQRMSGEEIPPSVKDTQRISTMSSG